MKAPAGTAAPAAASSLVTGEQSGRAADNAVREERLQQQSQVDENSRLDSNMLVVEVQMSPEAMKRGDFKRVLERNQIVFDDVKLDASKTESEALPQSEKKSPDAEAQVRAKTAPDRGIAEKSNEERRSDGDLKDGSQKLATEYKQYADESSLAKTDVICVDASPKQISATIADLRRLPETYFSVAVEPAADVVQQRANLNTGDVARKVQPVTDLPSEVPAKDKADIAAGQVPRERAATADALSEVDGGGNRSAGIRRDQKSEVVIGRARRLGPAELQAQTRLRLSVGGAAQNNDAKTQASAKSFRNSLATSLRSGRQMHSLR